MTLVQDVPERPTAAQLRRLRARLPYSVPLLRRLQVAGGAYSGVGVDGAAGIATTAHAHVLFVYEAEVEAAGADPAPAPDPNALPLDTPFAAAYVDVSQAPETAAWLFCSDEAPWPLPTVEGEEGGGGGGVYSDDDAGVVDRGAALVAAWSPARAARCHHLAGALLRRVRLLAQAAAPTVRPLLLARAEAAGEPASEPASAAYTGTGNITTARQAAATLATHLKATVHEGVRYLLTHPPAGANKAQAVHLTFCDAYDKWLFRAADVPAGAVAAAPLPAGLAWDRVRAGDVPLVVSRTAIPRTAATLLGVPSVGLRITSTPETAEAAAAAPAALASWAFLGIDGSLWTLHCEPAFRGQGLATAVAARLLRQNGGLFRGGDGDGDDENLWLIADVSATNRASQAVCRRLGGRRAWASSWIVVAYDSLGDD